MKLKATKQKKMTFLEILSNDDRPATIKSPISRREYASVEFPSINGELLIICGSKIPCVLVGMHYKEMFEAIAIANSKEDIAEVVHSSSFDYNVGGVIPLA